MRVSLINWEGDLRVEEVTWKHTSTREWGGATIIVPATSEAFSPDHIQEDGGFYVEISDISLGKWRGIADTPSINRDGAVIPCLALEALVTIRRVASSQKFVNCSAGAIIRAGFVQAFGGLGSFGITAGRFVEGGEVIPEYEFTGQYFDQVLGHMQDFTGQEWEIDADKRFNWKGRVGYAYELPLSDSGDLVDTERSGTIQDMAVSATARNSVGHEYTLEIVEHPAAVAWPREILVGTGENS